MDKSDNIESVSKNQQEDLKVETKFMSKESENGSTSEQYREKSPERKYPLPSSPEQMNVEANEENLEENPGSNLFIFRWGNIFTNAIEKWYDKNKDICFIVAAVILFIGITTYMIIALVWNFDRALTLLVIWCLFVAYRIYAFIRDHFGKAIMSCWEPFYDTIKHSSSWLKWVCLGFLVAGIALWIALDTSKRPNQLISGAGYFVFLFCLFLTSKYPSRVKWRPVFWGLFIQILLGLIILRTQAGFDAFNWLGNLVRTFIDFTDAGAEFLYGTGFREHFFAFKVLTIVVYFSAFVSVLYYLGAMQWLLFKLCWLMQISLGTSATETMVAAGNIFIGQTEAPLLIRPYFEDLTQSELFAVMVCGFATVAGSTLGAYLSFGIDAVYLITACVMSSPCALAVAKLVYPETKKSKFTTTQGLAIEKGEERNVMDAAAQGASVAIFLALNIGANLIVFVSLLSLVNAVLSWFGGLLNFPELSFELICSYIFVPMTYLMGIEWVDCFKSAELVGVGIFLNEFVAYDSLSTLIKQRNNGTIPRIDPDSGSVNWISERSEAIMTYALCGFANVASIGIQLGGLGSLAPSRRGDMAQVVIRAVLVGTAVNILNACVAGFLYVPRPIFCDNILNATSWVSTETSRLHECCFGAVQAYQSINDTSIACNCCAYNWNETQFNLNCSLTAC